MAKLPISHCRRSRTLRLVIEEGPAEAAVAEDGPLRRISVMSASPSAASCVEQRLKPRDVAQGRQLIHVARTLVLGFAVFLPERHG